MTKVNKQSAGKIATIILFLYAALMLIKIVSPNEDGVMVYNIVYCVSALFPAVIMFKYNKGQYSGLQENAVVFSLLAFVFWERDFLIGWSDIRISELSNDLTREIEWRESVFDKMISIFEYLLCPVALVILIIGMICFFKRIKRSKPSRMLITIPVVIISIYDFLYIIETLEDGWDGYPFIDFLSWIVNSASTIAIGVFVLLVIYEGADKPVYANEQANKPVYANEQANKPVYANEQANKPVYANEQVDKPVKNKYKLESLFKKKEETSIFDFSDPDPSVLSKTNTMSITDQIRALEADRASGAISEEEYEEKRQAIIDKM